MECEDLQAVISAYCIIKARMIPWDVVSVLLVLTTHMMIHKPLSDLGSTLLQSICLRTLLKL